MGRSKHGKGKLWFVIEGDDGYMYCLSGSELIVVDVSLVNVGDTIKFKRSKKITSKGVVKAIKDSEVKCQEELQRLATQPKYKPPASSFHEDEPRKAAKAQRELMANVIHGKNKQEDSDTLKGQTKSMKRRQKKEDAKKRATAAKMMEKESDSSSCDSSESADDENLTKEKDDSSVDSSLTSDDQALSSIASGKQAVKDDLKILKGLDSDHDSCEIEQRKRSPSKDLGEDSVKKKRKVYEQDERDGKTDTDVPQTNQGGDEKSIEEEVKNKGDTISKCDNKGADGIGESEGDNAMDLDSSGKEKGDKTEGSIEKEKEKESNISAGIDDKGKVGGKDNDEDDGKVKKRVKKSKKKKSKKNKKKKKAKKHAKRNSSVYEGQNYLYNSETPNAVKLHENYEDVYVLKADLEDAKKAKSTSCFIRNMVDKIYTKEAMINSTPQGFPPRGKGKHYYRDKPVPPRLHPAGMSALFATAKSLEATNKMWRPKLTDNGARNAFSVVVSRMKPQGDSDSSSDSSSSSSSSSDESSN